MSLNRIVLSIILILLFSLTIQAGENLLSNGGFEEGIYGWNIKESSLDYNNSFSGNVSLHKAGDLGNTWNTVSSHAVDVDTSKQYILSFYSMNNGDSGDLYAGIRWINNAGISLTYSWQSLEIDTGWEYYTLMVRPPQGASKMQVYFRLGEEFIGDAWFDEVVLVEMEVIDAEPLMGTGPLGFAGSLVSEISHTPEENWVGGLRLQLYSNIAFGSQVKGFINIGGWLPQKFQFHEFSGPAAIRSDFKIKKAYIEIDGPWFSGLGNLRTTLGDAPVEYSPFTINLNRWDLWDWAVMDNLSDPINYNKVRRGISIETLNWNSGGLGCYLLWDDKPTKYSFGGFLSLGKETKNHMKLTYTRYQDTTNVSPGEKPSYIDQAFTIEGMLRRDKYRIKGIAGSNAKALQNKSENGNLYLIDAVYYISGPNNVFVRHWSLDDSFDPIFRDRTPKYDYFTGEKLEWNLVDRFKGQSGYEIGVSLYKDMSKVMLIYSKASDVDRNIIGSATVNTLLKLGEMDVWIDYESSYTRTEPYEFGVINSDKHLAINAEYPLHNDGIKSYWLNGCYSFHDTSRWGKEEVSYLLLKSQFDLIFVDGVQSFIGVRSVKEGNLVQNGFVIGVDCYLVQAINVTLRYASPNIKEEFGTSARGFWDTRFDKYGHPIMADNIFKVSASVEF